MNIAKIYYVKDFILLINKHILHTSIPGYEKISTGSNSVIYYLENSVHSHCTLKNSSNVTNINWFNSFYPLFYYENKDCTILTSNFSHFFSLNLSLSINQNGIKEFIIFNTTLGKNTFFNEVERIFGINKIIIKKDEVNFQFFKENELNLNLLSVFNNNINYIINQTSSDNHGIFLSGGNESRINAAIANHYQLERKYITWGHPDNKENIIASKISKKSNVKHINIRPQASELPYREFLNKTGFLSNMQYAYRYQAVKMSFAQLGIDHLWTGWGDITGYIPINFGTEFFNNTFWYYTNNYDLQSSLFNKDFISSYNIDSFNIPKQNRKIKFLKFLFHFFHKQIAPRIYGQVLSAENTSGHIIAPWFSSKLYECIIQEESVDHFLYLRKRNRVMWKNNLYANLIDNYDSRLNYIKNAKNYYPFLFKDYFKPIGLPVAFLLTKMWKKSGNLFDPVENINFIRSELIKCMDYDIDYFVKNEIQNKIKNSNNWTGPDIMELFKVIQISWLLEKTNG